jgi:hypothetical protein
MKQRCHNRKTRNINFYRRENIRSHVFDFFFLFVFNITQRNISPLLYVAFEF